MEKAFTSFLVLLQYYIISSSAMTQFNIFTDQLALLSLKSKIISDPFHFLDESWSPAISVYHWVGVTCGSRHQRVKSLNLSNMALTDRIPQDLGNLSFLASLDLGSNNFHGNLPQEMACLHRIMFLDLSFNNFRGEVPSLFGFLRELQFLSLKNNSFTGPLPSSFFNISKIEMLNLAFNSVEGHIPVSLSNASRLERLELSGNLLQRNIPSEIGNLHNLNWLAIQYNQLTGLLENKFDGPIHSEIGRLSNLQQLYLGTNHLTGIIPHKIGNLVNLMELWMKVNQTTGSLARNNLNGFLPLEIGKLTKIQFLYLEQNRFSGEIPKEMSNLIELEELLLDLNDISGPLPMEIFNISRLRIVDLSFNNLSGSLPPNIELTILDLSYNKLTGLIPSSLGYLTHLRFLNMRENNLTSDSSLSFLTSLPNCKYLTTLSLSFNPLNSMLPVSVGNFSTSLIKFYANSCKIKGRIPNDFGNLSSLLDLDLSENSFVGSIPTTIGNLRNIQCFNLTFGEIHLGSNKLSSNIPPSIGNLQDLVVLDLSSNNMVGSLPPEIGNLKAATLIDLSMNQFSNGIPREIGGLRTLLHLSLRHNKLQGSIPDSLRNMRISYYELLQATYALSESNLIGSGSFGSVYKGVLRSGISISVKVFNLQLDAAFKSFDTECEVLRILRHRNLVKAITSCSNLDFNALAETKHNDRCGICIGISPSWVFVACDMKPSNVLLDEDMVAHLSDFGISKLLDEDQGDLYTKNLATLGHLRQYGLEGLVSTKCDVHSYGVMFLETFTRRKPNGFEVDLSLKQWVSYSLPDAVMDIVDANLVTQMGSRLQMELDVVASIMKVALHCCAESPARRTNMKDVVGMLRQINIQLLAC
ncbi:hypothetical protein P3S67_013331 [Capsicum chacoense]